MKKPLVTTIVVNWNLKDDTAECLRSLEHLEYPTRVLVVDNGSEDGSVDYLSARFPAIEIINSPVNLGFGAACNMAISRTLKRSPCDYILLLNNDAVIHPTALTALVNAAQAHPEVGVFGPKIYCNDKPGRLWYAGARRRWGVLAAADTGRGQVDRGQFDARREIDFVFGATMFIRRSVFERIGLFDEQFFLYLEDLDFCLRAQDSGFSLLFVPQAHVHHKGSASTVNYLALRKYHYVTSTIFFLKKHASPVLILPLFTFWTLVFLRTVITDLLRGDSVIFRPYWSGLVSGLSAARRNGSPPANY